MFIPEDLKKLSVAELYRRARKAKLIAEDDRSKTAEQLMKLLHPAPSVEERAKTQRQFKQEQAEARLYIKETLPDAFEDKSEEFLRQISQDEIDDLGKSEDDDESDS